jgi:hypothetical protein
MTWWTSSRRTLTRAMTPLESVVKTRVLIICRCAWLAGFCSCLRGLDVYSCHVISVMGVATLVVSTSLEAGCGAYTFDGDVLSVPSRGCFAADTPPKSLLGVTGAGGLYVQR